MSSLGGTSRSSGPPRIWRFVARMRPEEVIFLAFALAIVAIEIATRTPLLTTHPQPAFFGGMVAFITVFYVRSLRAARRDGLPEPYTVARRDALRVTRDFGTLFAILVLYETLHDLTPLLRPDVVDEVIIAIDRRLFGVDVAVWLGEHCANRWLTYAMVFCYTSYFFSTVLLGAYIYWKDELRLYADFRLAIAILSVLGFTGYLLVPVVGPYIYQASLFPERLPGGSHGTYFVVSAIDGFRGYARDCFPSLHTATTTVVIVYARRFRRWLFWAYLPVGLGVYFSTLYLRMHYAVDLAAGFFVAAVAVLAAPRVNAAWERWQQRLAEPATRRTDADLAA